MTEKLLDLCKKGKVGIQLSILLFVMVVFFGSGNFYQRQNGGNYIHRSFVEFLLFFILFALCMGITIWVEKGKVVLHKKQLISFFKKIFAEHIYLWIVILVSAIPRALMLGTPQKWDSLQYYYELAKACEQFDFTPVGFWKGFQLCSHPTMGVSFFVAIGEWLNHYGEVGVQIVTCIMTVLTLACLYRMLREFLPHMTKFDAALATLMCSYSPLFLGTSAYFNPDYYLIVFFVMMIYFYWKNWHILYAICGLCLIQSKETGILFAFFWSATVVIYQFCHIQGSFKDKALGCVWNVKSMISVIWGIWEIAFILIVGGVSAWQSADGGQEVVGPTSVIGINIEYIKSKLSQLFVLNFAWIVWTIILVAFVVYMVRVSHVTRFKRPKLHIVWYGIPVCMIGYGLFTLFVITANLHRYNVLWTVLSVLIGVLAVYGIAYTFQKKYIYYFSCCVLLVLFCAQTYKNIDPISNRLFLNIQTSDDSSILSVSNDGGYKADCTVYNYQYAWIDKAIDEIMEKESFDEETMFSTGDISVRPEGNWSAGCRLYWDGNHDKRTLCSSDNILVTTTEFWFNGLINMADGDAIRIDAPQNVANSLPNRIISLKPYGEGPSEDEQKFLNRYYCLDHAGMSSNYGGEIPYDVYRVKKVEDTVEEDIEWNVSTQPIFEDLYQLKDETAWIPKVTNRQEIWAGDQIQIHVEVAYIDENGERVVSSDYYSDITVGDQTIIKEINEALIKGKVGEDIIIQYQYPTTYVHNPNLSGKIGKITIYPVKIYGELDSSNEKINAYLKKYCLVD